MWSSANGLVTSISQDEPNRLSFGWLLLGWFRLCAWNDIYPLFSYLHSNKKFWFMLIVPDSYFIYIIACCQVRTLSQF